MTAANRYFSGTSVRGPVKASQLRTFRELVDALRIYPTLPFTHAAFLALGEKQRNEAKQVPFFVPACFKNSPSKRITEEATHCNLIFLDIDPDKENRGGKWVETGIYPAAPFVKDPDSLYVALKGFNFAAHLTASSTPEKPRMRIIVDADEIPLIEYPASATAIGERLGLPSVTRESMVAVQPMFLPVRFADSPADYHPLIAHCTSGRSFGVMDLFDSPAWIGSSTSNGLTHLNGSEPSADELENLRDPDPEITLAIAKDALDGVDPDCSRSEWIEIAAALKHQFSQREDAEAFKLFDEWSSGGSKYGGENETRGVWNSVRQTPAGRAPITIRTLLRRAKDAGWVNLTIRRVATLDAYYDSARKEYLVQNAGGRWHAHPATSFKVHLKARGISTKAREGESLSEAEKAMIAIQNDKDVRYHGPLAGHQSGFYDEDGVRFLVTDSPKIAEPIPSDCSTILALLAGLVGADSAHGDRQLATLLGWLKVAYEALRAGKRQPGPALTLAGPVDCGKSLLQQFITALIGGRSAKAMRYMCGGTEFNADLFGAEHLILEDEQSSTDIRTRLKMAARIKEMTVNDVHSCHGKGRDAVSLRPYWRLSLSVNDQPESLLVLPPITPDIADKIILLRCLRPMADFPTGTHELRKAYWERLISELPAFAYYLTQYFIPVELTDARFGIRHFHHPELLASLGALSPEAKLLELIDRELWKTDAGTVQLWHGTAAELEGRLRMDFSGVKNEAAALLKWDQACGTYLGRLAANHPDRVREARTAAARKWRINPPSRDPMDEPWF